MNPETLFYLLSDPTRLRCLMLIHTEQEICVCELTHALEESQPKISRHLALLRDEGVVIARREGTWMHYRVNSKLPAWARRSLTLQMRQLEPLEPFPADRDRLQSMDMRPGALDCA
ncbi:MAG: metalloregulator ArsR/SmtB family transcription factor [Gammaproteobacteria bacterium]|nr:metalloregulator ArsR/SmtB family transcription factor [Gammaproteobacteria bacterium]MBT8057695.1 metalloregulator ArsR/SmtB family transcription factor [Gammaproteobacteria bacterium]NNJ78481.1 metalloregulator ArsR/SmtB family transcription factor [Xanthomonadales bacterium]